MHSFQYRASQHRLRTTSSYEKSIPRNKNVINEQNPENFGNITNITNKPFVLATISFSVPLF